MQKMARTFDHVVRMHTGNRCLYHVLLTQLNSKGAPNVRLGATPSYVRIPRMEDISGCEKNPDMACLSVPKECSV